MVVFLVLILYASLPQGGQSERAAQNHSCRSKPEKPGRKQYAPSLPDFPNPHPYKTRYSPRFLFQAENDETMVDILADDVNERTVDDDGIQDDRGHDDFTQSGAFIIMSLPLRQP